MNRKITVLSGTYVLFLLLLFVSGCVQGVISEIVYFSAFLLPLAFGILMSENRKENLLEYFSIDKKGITITLYAIFPTVLIVLAVSLVTSFVIEGLTGATNQVDIGDSLAIAILNHAVLPALLEEMLFRYLPMRLLLRHSPKVCLFVSAFFFALVHHDLFSIPYAFVAGIVFMVVDIMCDSVIPSLIIHFVNNLMSVILMFYSDSGLIKLLCIGAVVLLTLISLVFIVIHRDEYKEKIKNAFPRGEKMKFNFSMLMFALACLAFAVLGLA
jgi:membrane protease YdiL (CAAX protease family)